MAYKLGSNTMFSQVSGEEFTTNALQTGTLAPKVEYTEFFLVDISPIDAQQHRMTVIYNDWTTNQDANIALELDDGTSVKGPNGKGMRSMVLLLDDDPTNSTNATPGPPYFESGIVWRDYITGTEPLIYWPANTYQSGVGPEPTWGDYPSWLVCLNRIEPNSLSTEQYFCTAVPYSNSLAQADNTYIHAIDEIDFTWGGYVNSGAGNYEITAGFEINLPVSDDLPDEFKCNFSAVADFSSVIDGRLPGMDYDNIKYLRNNVLVGPVEGQSVSNVTPSWASFAPGTDKTSDIWYYMQDEDQTTTPYPTCYFTVTQNVITDQASIGNLTFFADGTHQPGGLLSSNSGSPSTYTTSAKFGILWNTNISVAAGEEREYENDLTFTFYTTSTGQTSRAFQVVVHYRHMMRSNA